jgi:hypothetical protein
VGRQRSRNMMILLHIFRRVTGAIPETEIAWPKNGGPSAAFASRRPSRKLRCSRLHKTSVETLQRLAHGLGLRLVTTVPTQLQSRGANIVTTKHHIDQPGRQKV